MNLGLQGKAFVVCGGSRGLGRAVADELVSEGARVLLAWRSGETLEQATAELGTNAFAFPCDLSLPEEADRLAATVSLTLGQLDGAFASIGGIPGGGDVLELDDEDWRAAFDVLIGRPVRLVRKLVPLLGGEGALLLASSAARQPARGSPASNVLRPGVEAMVMCLARELAPEITVNRLVSELEGADDARPAFADGLSPGRLGAFLLSPAGSNVTGATLRVDDVAVRETA